MLVYYYKSEKLNLFIAIVYNFSKESQKIILQTIKFFENEENVKNYLKQNKLELNRVDILKEDNEILKLVGLFNAYLSGDKINLPKQINKLDIELALNEKFKTKFSQDVLKIMLNLGYGEITSYSEIGNKIGSKAYRAIGTILKKNPLPLIIPCHRVIKKNGKIGGFMGKIDNKWQQKLKSDLLKIESIDLLNYHSLN